MEKVSCYAFKPLTRPVGCVSSIAPKAKVNAVGRGTLQYCPQGGKEEDAVFPSRSSRLRGSFPEAIPATSGVAPQPQCAHSPVAKNRP